MLRIADLISKKIVNEHMATSVTRTFLLNMLRATEVTDPAPAIVIATTVGQWHDVGALIVALTAVENGCTRYIMALILLPRKLLPALNKAALELWQSVSPIC